MFEISLTDGHAMNHFNEGCQSFFLLLLIVKKTYECCGCSQSSSKVFVFIEQGVTAVRNRDAPFKKNASFTTPISERLDPNPEDYTDIEEM